MYNNTGFYQDIYGQGNSSFIPKGLLDLPMYQQPTMQNLAQPSQPMQPAMPMQEAQQPQSGMMKQTGMQQAAAKALTSMGMPEPLAQLLSSKIGGSRQPDMPMQVQEMTPMQFQQPQQVANGSSQYVQMLQGLLG